MKKSHLFLATLLVVAAVSVAVVSCKKEKQETSTNNTEQAVLSADNMDEYLISFKKKLLSAQKGDETISLEQAQRDLGNLLNFDFGDANYASNLFQQDTIQMILPTINGDCDYVDLLTIYKEAIVLIQETYSKVDLPEKSIYYISCSLLQKSKDGNAGVQLVVTTRGWNPNLVIDVFDESDNWRLDSLQGKCDGTCVGEGDHLTKLTQVYYNTRNLVSCDNGRMYFTDINQSDFWGANFPEFNPGGPYYNIGYWLWCGPQSNVPNYCVTYQEMRYYLKNLHNILDNWMFLNYDQLVLTIDLSVLPYYYPYIDSYSVHCDFEYATYHCTNEPLL